MRGALIRLVKHIEAATRTVPLVPEETRKNPHRRAFARAVRSEQTDDSPRATVNEMSATAGVRRSVRQIVTSIIALPSSKHRCSLAGNSGSGQQKFRHKTKPCR